MKRRQIEPWDYRSKEEYDFSVNCIGFTIIGFFLLIITILATSKNDEVEVAKAKPIISIPHQEKYSANITDGKRKYLDHLFNTQE
jgi:hypothetical protein